MRLWVAGVEPALLVGLCRMCRGGSYFRGQLWRAMLLVVLPLLVVQGLFLYRDHLAASKNAYALVHSQSQEAAKRVATVLRRAESLLVYLATREELRDAKRCAGYLAGLSALDPLYDEVLLADATGRVCSSTAATQPPLSPSLLKQAFAAQKLHLSAPTQVGAGARVHLTLPLPQVGDRVALVGVSLNVERLAAFFDTVLLPENGSVVLVDATDRMVTRHPEALQWSGRPVSNGTTRDKFQADDDQVIVALGADGVERVFASSDVGLYGLRVAAGVPVDVVYASIRDAERRSVVRIGLAVLLVSGLAFYWARKLAQPLNKLSEIAQANARGDTAARVSGVLPAEFNRLGQEINSMLDARDAATQALTESEQQAIQQAAFYEALSKTNQVIAQQPEPQQLFEALCRICVETTPARIAWVGLVENGTVTPVAWAGLSGADAASFSETVLQAGPAATSVRESRVSVVGDFRNDLRTSGWRDHAKRLGIGSAAAVPLRRGGRTVGTLNLYLPQANGFCSSLVSLLSDMTADVSQALDRHDMGRALRQHETHLASIIDSAMDAVVIVDSRDMKVVVFNRAAVRMFGCSAESVIGGSMAALLPERFRAQHGELLLEYAGEDRRDPAGGTVRSLVGRRASGEEFPIEASISEVTTSGSSLLTVMIRDMSELSAAREAQAAVIEAEAANKAKTDFLSRVSHELRTPLNAVIGFSQLLGINAGERLDPAERQQLDMIYLAGSQLKALIDDVLDVSRIEAGHLAIDRRDVELKHLLDGVLRLSEESARQASVALAPNYRVLPSLHLYTDPTRLRQVVLNLVSNGIKYNRAGGRVTIDVLLHDGQLSLRISDTGLGMSRAQMARLFEPFNRLGRERSEIAGTGIGLLLSKQLTELMGGKLVVRSNEGEGTVVTVTLPLACPSSEADHLEPPAVQTPAGIPPPSPSSATHGQRRADALPAALVPLPQSPPALRAAPRPPEAQHTDHSSRFKDETPGGLPQGRVLCIEDNMANAMLVKQLLKRWPDVQLLLAEDAATGIEQALSSSPDVILLDMNLPDGDGKDVLRILRQDPRTAKTPVIVLSASVMAAEKEAAFAAGANQFWGKPIEFAPFLEGIAVLLARRREDALLG